jgi:hypothetical protein
MPQHTKEGKQVSIPGMEIIAHRDFTAAEARAVTDRIRSSMGDLMEQIVRAHIGRAWLALGYSSWVEYIKGEFNHAPLSLPRAERKAVTAVLRGQGFSTRAIAAATGDSHMTVKRDLDEAPVTNVTGDREPLDVEFDEDQLAEELIAAEPPNPVRGLDGKNYPPKMPTPSAAPEPRFVTEAVTAACPTCGGTGEITKQITRDGNALQ